MLNLRPMEEDRVESPAPAAEECWNLEDLFADEAAFRKAQRALRDELVPRIERCRGSLLGSATELADALDAASQAHLALHSLYAYASLRSDEDTRIGAHQALRQEIRLLGTEVAKCAAYLRPEILEADPVRIEAFIAREPRLAPHAFFLRDLVRQRSHVLTPGEERLLAEGGLVRGHPGTLYELLTNVELPRPEVRLESGESVRLTPVAFHKHRRTPVRDDRLRLFPAYYSAYSGFRDTLGINLYAVLKEHLFAARARRYPSCLAAALDGDQVPESVYRNLILRVRQALPLFHRYLRLRAKFLGIDQLEYPDLSCPLGKKPALRYSPDRACELLLDCLRPLGDEYGSALAGALRSRWIDWHPREGKRSGAYCSGSAYDVHPYVLLNYTGDNDSVSTLAHEMGHAMHSYYSNQAQPFPTADYSIFVAEVASTFNEALLLRGALAAADSDEARLFVLGSYLDGFRGTLFRQTMFAEFELEIHERAERGEALTGEALDATYLELLRAYHGHDQGVVRIDQVYAVEWASVPHFYYDFYVFQYATGIVAAGALARAVLSGLGGARDRYLEFLRSGGSDYPLALLRRAGVDLEQAAPYQETFASIDGHLDSLESLLDTVGAGSDER